MMRPEFIGQRVLSTRRREVVLGLADGLSLKEIAVNLGISHKTIEEYVRQVKPIFECKSMHELIVCSVHWKLAHENTKTTYDEIAERFSH